MVFRLPYMISSSSKQAIRFHSKSQKGVPKGHVAVYVGDGSQEKKRYVVSLTCLNHPAFLNLLRRAEEEFGYNHSMGGLTIPCDEATFIHVLNSQ